MENDDENPVTDASSEIELVASLDEMIATAAKSLKPQEIERLRALVYRFKDIKRL
jgi:hypothetical protein